MATKTKEIKAQKVSPVQSIVSNLHSTANGKYDAAKAKFILSSLRKKSGVCEQALIVKLIMQGFETSKEYAAYRSAIKAELAEYLKAQESAE